MSFRKKKNSHDEWVAFKDKNSNFFKLFVVTNLNSVNQESFEEYLTLGNSQFFHTIISELDDQDFLVLEKIVSDWESFGLNFDAFYSERIKRFNRYG